MKKLIIFVLLYTFSHIALSQSDLCQRCYQQKANLTLDCYNNHVLYAMYPQWCTRITAQAKLLKIVAKKLDQMLNHPILKKLNIKRLYAHRSSRLAMQLPYDDCDACFNNIFILSTQCYTQKQLKRSSLCKSVQHEALNLTQTVGIHPYVLAEPLDK